MPVIVFPDGSTVEVFLTDKADDAPLMPVHEGEPLHKKLLDVWSEWARHYGLTWHPTAADWRIAKRLTSQRDMTELLTAVREFWLVESGTSVLTPEATKPHFVYFAAFLKRWRRGE